jgi:MATE family multidrug resistance protein
MVVDHERVGAALRRLAVPVGLAMMADQLLGIVDTVAIGTLGPRALAGITAAVSVFIVLAIGMFAFGSGPRIMGSQAIGAGDLPRFGRIVRSAMVVPLALACCLALASLVVARPLMDAMLGSLPGRDAAAHYLMLRCVSLIPMVATGIIIAGFGAVGETRLTLRALLVINAVHLPLVAALVLGVGTHRSYGLVGAGFSSLAAECVGLAFCIWQARRRPAYRIFSGGIDRALVRATAMLSWPEFVFLILIMVPEPLTVGWLAPLGVLAIGAFRALSIVSDITWALPGSLGDATEIVVGQRIGAVDYAGAAEFARRANRFAVAVCGAVALTFGLAAWPLAALVTWNPAIATLAMWPLAAQMLTLPLKGYAMTTLAPIRASGDTKFVMWTGVGSSIIVSALLYVCIVHLNLGLYAVPIAWITSWLARSIVTTMRLETGNWRVRRLAA